MATQKQIEANRRNAQKAGRKKGTKNPATLEREKVLAAVQQQIMEKAAGLVRSAMIPANGMNFVYRIDKKRNKKGDVIFEKNVLVTDPHEIENALDLIADSENGKNDNEFYFITTERPDHNAIKMLMDRAFGKPKESLDVNNPDGNLKTIIINKAAGKK